MGDTRLPLGTGYLDSVVRQMQQIFEEDWAQTDSGRKKLKKEKKADKREEKVLAAAS